MAWVGQCRVAFKVSATALLLRQDPKNRRITKVLRQLSEESDIPLSTLKRWWAEERSENGPNTKTPIKSDGKDGKPLQSAPICSICKERPANRKRRPDGSWYYYDRCSKCREIVMPSYEAKADIQILCPLCGGKFKLKKEDLKYE